MSSALTQLAARGDIARRDDGGWVLRGQPVGMPTEEVSRVIELRRRRVRDGGIPIVGYPRTSGSAATAGGEHANAVPA